MKVYQQCGVETVFKHIIEAHKGCIVEEFGEESLTVTCRATCCSITSVCMCVGANLDIILGVQPLDKTGETVKETIRCSSLEG